MTRAQRVVTFAVVLAGFAACSGDSTGGAQPGTLTVSLTTPNADDGAMLFALRGPAIDTVQAVNGSLLVFTHRVNDSTVTGVAVGAVASGLVLTIAVPDVGAVAAYSGTVTEVADRQNAIRSRLDGYALRVQR